MLKGKRYYKTCKRDNTPGQAHALTFTCYQGRPFLSRERTCQWLVQAIDQARSKHNFSLWAYVIMPEHVHLLLCSNEEVYNISNILKAIKQPVAQKAIAYLKRENPKGLHVLEVSGHPDTYRFWQEGGGYDRNISRDRTLMNVVRYIHANPVRRGLVATLEQWEYSSANVWQGYEESLPIDMETFPWA